MIDFFALRCGEAWNSVFSICLEQPFDSIQGILNTFQQSIPSSGRESPCGLSLKNEIRKRTIHIADWLPHINQLWYLLLYSDTFVNEIINFWAIFFASTVNFWKVQTSVWVMIFFEAPVFDTIISSWIQIRLGDSSHFSSFINAFHHDSVCFPWDTENGDEFLQRRYIWQVGIWLHVTFVFDETMSTDRDSPKSRQYPRLVAPVQRLGLQQLGI